MTCSVNHSTITTKFCSVCGAPATTAQAPAQPPQWNQPPAAAPQWNQPPAAAPQWNQPPAQPYAAQPTYGAPQQAWATPPVPLAGYSFPLASIGKRIGAGAIDFAIYAFGGLFTCGLGSLGWMIWSLIAWKDGQTPGKLMLKLRTYGTVHSRPATWGHMAVRQLLIPLTYYLVVIPVWIADASYDPYSYYSTDYTVIAGVFALIAYVGIFILELITLSNSPIRQRLTDKWAKTVVLDESYR